MRMRELRRRLAFAQKAISKNGVFSQTTLDDLDGNLAPKSAALPHPIDFRHSARAQMLNKFIMLKLDRLQVCHLCCHDLPSLIGVRMSFSPAAPILIPRWNSLVV